MSHDGQSGADRLLTMQWHDVRSTLQLILAKKRLHREEETISVTHKATTTVYLTWILGVGVSEIVYTTKKDSKAIIEGCSDGVFL